MNVDCLDQAEVYDIVELGKERGITLTIPGSAFKLLTFAENVSCLLDVDVRDRQEACPEMYKIRKLCRLAQISRTTSEDPIDFPWY